MQKSYAQILKATALFGFASVVNIASSIVRVKILAVLLGPAGVGLFGLYSLVQDLTVNVAGLGLQSSGVRQIAEAAASDEAERIARTARVLNLMSLGLGIVGALALVALATPVAHVTFGTGAEAGGVALLGAAVFLKLAAAGPAAVVQGTRRIGDLTRMLVIGAILSTVVTIPLVYFFGEGGIVPSFVGMALVSLIAALWYLRKARLPRVTLGPALFQREGVALVRLGFAFMVSTLLAIGAAYTVRILVLQRFGVEAAGLYQAAWAIGGLYAGFILQAMGTDFYPRLTGVANDHVRCNQMVNEQARISMLLAGPGLVATMTLAPLVLVLFYSSAFQPAVPLLRWLCLGMLLRIVAWPLGFVILAKGAQKTFLWTEIAATVVNVGLTWVLLPVIGLEGAGAAFVGLYVWHGLLVYWLVRRMTGFRWSADNVAAGALLIAASVAVFAVVSVLPFWPGTIIGIVATAAACLYALVELARLVPPQSFPPLVRPLLSRLAAFGIRRSVGAAE